MSSSVFSGTKNFWRKSVRQKESPIYASDIGTKHPFEPAYAKYAFRNPEACKIVAVAEPRPEPRLRFVEKYRIDGTLTFNSWQDLHAASAETIKAIGKRLADAVLIAVQDHLHVEVALAFAEQGYHILCEKPMATSLRDCIMIEEAIKKAGIIFGMGHGILFFVLLLYYAPASYNHPIVMRYSPYSQEITKIVRSGTLGKLINIVQVEPVGHYHFAHSYVRGNWAKEKSSSFSLMTKSCHDIDIICHWFGATKPKKVSSFGSLQHFRPSGKPVEAGDAVRCFDCSIAHECPYSAKRIYLDRVTRGSKGWPVSVIVDDIPDIENVTEALKTGPYGRCVYECENDVCDNQVVNLEFENGETASFTMVAFTSAICDRQLRMHFTHGEIIGDMSTFTVTDFRQNKTTTHRPKDEGGGHGGGDMGLIRAFVEAVRTGDQKVLGTDIEEVLKSHLTVFAAETSRREGMVVNCMEFEEKARENVKQANVHELR
ncbi:hypothetical protein VNI00_005680 [Paramarasmius palmivorus]|uniref:NAD(P)-binding protein n=1 Tax=Paramarasmius palmivorus TaxID=297713 RepID=A0AAW0DES4_9AGAR